MNDLNNPNSESEDKRPKLRCPACSFMVPLPAENCPKCRANLRSGIIPEEEEPRSGRFRLIIVGLILLVIIGLAGVFFSGVLEGPPLPAAKAPSADGISETLDAIQELPNQNIGVRPDIMLNRAKDTAEEAEGRRKMEKDTEEFQPY